jgi:hypothetical protein
MTQKEKDRLAELCGYSKENYIDKVRCGVRKKLKLSYEDEIAILRKALSQAISELSELKMAVKNEMLVGEPITDFIVYDSKVEQIKIESKK